MIETAYTALFDAPVRVTGTPKTKGSLRHVGDGRHVEQVAGSTTWKRRVARACAEAYRGAPCDEPVVIRLRFYVDRPASPIGPARWYPASKRSGDLDKLYRNVGDALTLARVLKDDSRIVEASVSKAYADDEHPAGVEIEVYMCTPGGGYDG